MSSKLYVGSLSFKIDDSELEKIFSQVGEVKSATVLTDKQTGQSKGFGFVEMSTDAEAKSAIQKLNGTEHDGRKIIVSEARPQTKGGGGGFDRDSSRRGGFGGNRGGNRSWK